MAEAEVNPQAAQDARAQEILDALHADMDLSKGKRDEHLPNWQLNVNERRGKDFDTAADEGRSRVPLDWTLTKTKVAQLWSQLPQVRLMPKNTKLFGAAVPVASIIVNDLVKFAKVDAVMFETVPDVVNAAGIAAAIVRYESLSEVLVLPAVDKTAVAMAAMANPGQEVVEDEAAPIPQVDSTRKTDARFCVDRISPKDLLWPTKFDLSDWDKAPWLGRSCRGTWAEVKRRLNLPDSVKDQVVGAAAKKRTDATLANSSAQHTKGGEDLVEYDELFYWRYIYHEDEKYYDAIQHVVWVTGMDKPHINEPWKGQKFDGKGHYLGSCKLPIRVLTLNYISDEAIPPSDSAIIRPQVKELQESRQQMKEQRKHSRPLRWFDVDHVDPTIIPDLVNGTWQGMIPTIGAGDRALGEVARSAYPRENLDFDRILKQDIQEAVSIGPNQSGAFASGERSAKEASIVDRSFQTEIGVQRARVASFFVGIAEVLFGLWALYGDLDPLGIGASLDPDQAHQLEQWDRTRINQKFIADVRVDSTVRMDAKEVIEQVTQVLNMTAQSGFVNPKPLIRKIFDAAGIDPAEAMVDPQPKKPEPPKLSYAFKGEDMLNPFIVAIIGQVHPISPEELEAAKKMIISMQLPPKEVLQGEAERAGLPDPTEVLESGGGNKPPGGKGGPGGAPPSAPPPGPGGPPPPKPGAMQNPQVPQKARPDWETTSRVNTRRPD